jgi:hypothetical protein
MRHLWKHTLSVSSAEPRAELFVEYRALMQMLDI